MNRFSRETGLGGKNVAFGAHQHHHHQQQQLRRGGAAASGGGSRDGGDESLDLFSRIQQNKNVPLALEREGVGSHFLGRSRIEDLFSADTGKNDYDWLLTPPGTPILSSPEVIDQQPTRATPRNNSNTGPVSTGKASRFSSSQLENANVRSARSSSTTRSSVSNTYSSSSYLSNTKRTSISNAYSTSSYISNNNRTSILNTSTASVTSKPSPSNKPSVTASTVRTTPVTNSRSMPSHSLTPVKARASPSSPRDKPRTSQNSRPATPIARPRTPSVNPNPSSHTPVIRSNSRPSTPTCRTPSAAQTPTTTRSTSVGRGLEINSRNPGHASRPSSPAQRDQAPAQALPLPHFPLDTPLKLRTKLPERALSAGKQRPGTASTVRASRSSEATVQESSTRRHSSPVAARGRLRDNSFSAPSNSIAHEAKPAEKKKPVASNTVERRLIKSASPLESNGFGRTISKKSMDMAIKHMDIRQTMGSAPGASVFPRSIRSAAVKSQPAGSSDQAIPILNKVVPHAEGNGITNAIGLKNDTSSRLTSRDYNGAVNGVKPSDKESRLARANQRGVFESSRYNAILLKEDAKNLNWLHGIEDMNDQSPMFDHRFGPLPEPFGLI